MPGQTYDHNGNLLTASGGGGGDASEVTFTPTTLSDWDSSADPGNVDDALDQLAGRVTVVEAGGDAANVTYTPLTLTDWNSSADPGNVDDALDQLADRTKTLESASGEQKATIIDQKAQNTSGGTFNSGAWRTRDLNTKVSDPDTICSILKLAFTSGGTYQIVAGDVITGASSSATATVFDVELTSGSWAGGDAAGNLWLVSKTGTFVSENLNVGANSNVATIAGDTTTNEVRLLAGTYRIAGSAPGHRVNDHQARIMNTTDAAQAALGAHSRAGATVAVTTRSVIPPTRITIAAAKTFELQHICGTSFSDGFGLQANLTSEIYSILEIVKET